MLDVIHDAQPTTNDMRIQVMLIATDSNADTTSVSTMVDLDTSTPGWHHGLVRTVTDQASAGAEYLREFIDTDATPLRLESPTPEPSTFQPAAHHPATFEPSAFVRPPAAFTPLAHLVPTA